MELYFHDPGCAADFSQILDESGFAEEIWERGRSHLALLPSMYETRLPPLHNVTRPSLLLRGADDMVTAPEMLAQFRASAPGDAVRTFDKSGHFAYLEEAAEYCEAVTNFVMQNTD